MPDDALQSRRRHRGVIGIESKVPIRDRSVLSLIYTPGVAEPCLAIHADPQKPFEYTSRGKAIASMRIVINGAGAAGIGTAKLLLRYGVKDIILCDRAGAIYKYRPTRMNWVKSEMALSTNQEGRQGSLDAVLSGADVFIGFSEGK